MSFKKISRLWELFKRTGPKREGYSHGSGKRMGWMLLGSFLILVSCGPADSVPTGTPALTETKAPSATATVRPGAAPARDLPDAGSILTLEEVDQGLRVYPGPVHYEGDLLTFEINLGEFVKAGDRPVTLQIDGRESVQVNGEWKSNYLRVQFDTTGLEGEHRLSIQAEHEGVEVDETYQLDILPASQRPEQERNPEWVSRDVSCCTLHYITDTAASRDMDWIARTVQEAAEDFDQYPTVDVTEKIDVYFIDRMWFNGAFGGSGELLIVYTDRFYGPSRGKEGLEILVRHELGHAVFPIFSYGEGLSVYLAGGHYKPEPLPERAAAMLEMDYYSLDRGPVSQHEIVYLHQAAVIDYMIETYGWEELRDYVQADSEVSNPAPGERDEIFQQALGISWRAFNEDFVEWLKAHDPGQQIQDLELTVELQELRRTYQEKYAPWPRFLLGTADETFARPEYLRVNIREPRMPAHIATELLIANAQQALNDGRYNEARGLIKVIESVVTSGRLEEPLAKEYGEVVLALAREGYETVSLDLHGNEAHVKVSASPPELDTLTLHKANGIWQRGAAPEGKEVGPTAFPTTVPSTPTPTPPPTSPVTTETVAREQPEDILYFDDFSDPNSGWDVYEDLKIFYGYENNRYRVFIDYPGAVYWFESGKSFSDVALESRVTLRDGPEINRVGLICRQDFEAGGMIQFLIDGEGRYGILWHEGGLPTYLGNEGMKESDAIRPLGHPNELRAVCAGKTLSFYANGELLLTTEDTVSSGKGDVGLTVSTIGGAGLEVVYDDFLAEEP